MSQLSSSQSRLQSPLSLLAGRGGEGLARAKMAMDTNDLMARFLDAGFIHENIHWLISTVTRASSKAKQVGERPAERWPEGSNFALLLDTRV